jgi:lysophospholipase L1-like esterase
MWEYMSLKKLTRIVLGLLLIFSIIVNVVVVLEVKRLNAPIERPGFVYLLGDSLTLSWPQKHQFLADKLGEELDSDWIVVNKGIGGNTTDQMLSRLQILLDDKPDYIVVWGGVNDIYQNIGWKVTQSNLQTIYTEIKENDIKVVAMTIPPSKDSVGYNNEKQIATDNINEWVLMKAEDVDYRLDIYSLLEDPGNPDRLDNIYNGGDRLHLSALAYYKIGEEIHDAVMWQHRK